MIIIQMKNISIILSILIVFGSCINRNASGAHSHENETGEHSHAEGAIKFTAAQADAAGLKTETVKLSDFHSIISTSGEILPAQGDEMTVIATSSGIISLGKGSSGILQGKHISKGDVLGLISAKDLEDGDPIVKSKASYEAAAKEYERAKELQRINAISAKAYEQAELQYNTAKAEYDAYRNRIEKDGLAIQSPLSGYIKQVLVSNGDYVSTGQAIAVITQNRRLQLQAELPEKYYSRISNITDGNFRPSYTDKAYNIKELSGKLVSSGKTAAEGSFYIPVIFEFDNTGDFFPGAFCDIYLIEGTEKNVISVPESALTEEQGIYFVYKKICKDEYFKQEVSIGKGDGIRREILKGLQPGDEIVISGAYQVKLASASGIIPEGHSHSH